MFSILIFHSFVSFSALFAAFAIHFFLSNSIAASMSQFDSTRAFLQSHIPTQVLSLSSLTCCAVIISV